MAKQIDHDAASAVATVGLETGKGIVGGVLTAAVIGGALTAGVMAAFGLPILAPALIAAGLSGFFGAGIGAAAGGAAGVLAGVGKVGDEKAAYQAKARAISAEPVVQAAQQQAYMAGVQDGQVAVVQHLQQAAEAQRSFADRVGKKDALKPETIIAQREAGSNTPSL